LQRRNSGKHMRIEQTPDDAAARLVRVGYLNGAGGRKNRVGHCVKHLGVQRFGEHLAVVHQGGSGGGGVQLAESSRP
jgi:hypothetical protein